MDTKWNIGWGVEDKCNMKCEFCYSKDVRKEHANLSLKDYINFIDKNSMYISSINYGTGENALSDHWFMLVKYIGENHPFIRQALTTNGYISTACNDSIKKKIFEKYIEEIDISLDFADTSRHNEFRGNPNAYNMAIKTMELCQDLNKQITLVFLGTNEVVQPNNLQGLFEIAHNYNAYLRTNIYRPTRGICTQKDPFILGMSNLVEMLNWISKNHKIIKVSDKLLAPVFFNDFADDHSGVSSLRILADGSITPSTYLINDEYRKYNIIDKSLHLNNIEFKDKIDVSCVPSECYNCKFVSKCRGGVYDRRILWYGTLKERDPYCPYRWGIFITQNVINRDSNFQSVHDGYLPTIFFSY